MIDQPLRQRLREIQEGKHVPAVEPPVQAPPERRRRRPLGRLLVEKGLVSEDVVEEALVRQRADGRPLGQILMEMGAVSPQNLARTLTEQHGFDFSGSLRERLSAGGNGSAPAAAPDEPVDAPAPDERYLVRDPGTTEPLHVASDFLDAADAAFELIDDRDPAELEIVRSRDGDLEHVWSYRRETAGFPPDHPSLS